MKKLILALILFILFIPIAFADNNPINSVCGNTYTLALNNQLYLADFPPSTFGPACGGTMTLYWSNQSRQYSFTTYENIFTTINGLGFFVLEDTKLIYIDPKTIILNQLN